MTDYATRWGDDHCAMMKDKTMLNTDNDMTLDRWLAIRKERIED
jgi:hypothetical protein